MPTTPIMESYPEEKVLNRPADLIRLMRPLHWIKNGFVFAGLLFGEIYNDPELYLKVFLAFFAFCFVSSAIYIVNDIADCEKDRIHPRKKLRPLPSGKVSERAAWFLGIFSAFFGLLIAYLSSPIVLVITLGYALMNVAYSYQLKHIVILDVFCISAGFMLRILAGTIGVGIPPSKWLLLCGLMVTLFLGFAKRRAEIINLNQHKEEHRKVLGYYSPILLDQIISICATGVIISYSLYTMSEETIEVHKTQNLIYTVPFVIYALFRYIYLLHHHNGGGDPTRDLIKDKQIMSCVVCWALLTTYLFIN